LSGAADEQLLSNMDAAAQYLKSTEDLKIPEGVVADHITYTALLQCYAYHGDLIRSLRVFADMITALGGAGERDGESSPASKGHSVKYMMPAYRAIFLGFVRHAKPVESAEKRQPLTDRLRLLRQEDSLDESAWTLEALESLFHDFIRLPMEALPSERFIFWVMRAFQKTSGNDIELMREVYQQLEARFGGRLGGRMERERQRLFG